MSSADERAEVKAMIQALYQAAHVTRSWDGEVNERVAEVFGAMLLETTKCSEAFAWVPRPTGGRASITWLVTNLGRGLFSIHKTRLSYTCARAVVYKWAHELKMASLNLSCEKLPLWG